MDCRCFLYGLEIAEIFSRKIQNLVPLGLDSLIPNFVAYMEDTVCGYSQMKCVRLSKINKGLFAMTWQSAASLTLHKENFFKNASTHSVVRQFV
jgi:hypothetical protein